MIINAENLILGRMGSRVVKKALLGEKIDIVNCEKAVVTGSKKNVLFKAREKLEIGQPSKGIFVQRQPDRFVRRAIRGMLPYKQEKGRSAYSRIMCWIGVPEAFKGQKIETVAEADVSKVPNLKFVTVKDICRHLGGKF